MRIIRESLFEGAKRAQGVAIVIDVFRAFTSTPLFFRLGAHKVIFVENPETAFSLKSNHDDILLAGEVDDLLIPGFDLGNSMLALSTGLGMLLIGLGVRKISESK